MFDSVPSIYNTYSCSVRRMRLFNYIISNFFHIEADFLLSISSFKHCCFCGQCYFKQKIFSACALLHTCCHCAAASVCFLFFLFLWLLRAHTLSGVQYILVTWHIACRDFPTTTAHVHVCMYAFIAATRCS